MKTLFALLIGIPVSLCAGSEKLIFDTDMGNDIDDSMALSVIHDLQSRGAIELLAVTSSKDHPLSAAFIDAQNTFYNRPDIPIGAVRNGVTKSAGRYLPVVTRKTPAGEFVYPHDLKSGLACPDAVKLLRQTLAAQADGSVSIAQVGFFTNLVRLLESPADDISPLTGVELIRKKVKQLGLMAGSFTDINGNKRYLEYNVVKDIPSAKKLAEKWPGKMIWSGFEIGVAVTYPRESIRDDYRYVKNHLVKESYIAYCGAQGQNATYDLTTVLQLAYPNRGYFSYSPKGKVEIADDGFTSFKEGAGEHVYLKIDDRQKTRLREAFVQMCSAPPR